MARGLSIVGRRALGVGIQGGLKIDGAYVALIGVARYGHVCLLTATDVVGGLKNARR